MTMSSATLISRTFFVDDPLQSMEDIIAKLARVSNPTNENFSETYPKLIRYLLKHRHWSPFEMAHMTILVTTSRAIAHQLIRHHSFRFQEFSQRYSPVDAVWNSSVIARRQNVESRQSSTEDLEEYKQQWFARCQAMLEESCHLFYKQALDVGIAREQARFILPESCLTRLYMTGNIRSWIHYLEARLSPDTQQEHRQLALQISEIFKAQLPTIHQELFSEREEVANNEPTIEGNFHLIGTVMKRAQENCAKMYVQ